MRDGDRRASPTRAPSPSRRSRVACSAAYLRSSLARSTILGGGAEARYRAVAEIDPEALAAFQAGIRRRYTDEQILEELRASRRAPRPLADDEGVRRRPGDAGAPADRDRALRHLERREARRRARAAAVRDARGARRRSCAGSATSSAARRPPRDIDERRGTMPSKSLYWHTFGSLVERAARGRLRRARWGRSGSSARSRRAPSSRGGSAGCRSSPTGSRARRADDDDADRVAGLPHVRVAPRRVGDLPVPGPRAPARGRRRRSAPTGRWRALEASRSDASAAASAASRVRQTSRSCGARTAGSGSSSTNSRSGRKRSRADDLAVLERERACPRAPRACAGVSAAVALDDLERELRRGEEDAVAALADPHRPARCRARA